MDRITLNSSHCFYGIRPANESVLKMQLKFIIASLQCVLKVSKEEFEIIQCLTTSYGRVYDFMASKAVDFKINYFCLYKGSTEFLND